MVWKTYTVGTKGKCCRDAKLKQKDGMYLKKESQITLKERLILKAVRDFARN